MTDLDVLSFARDHRPGESADVAMRAWFGSPTRYYQRLRRALEDPAALRPDHALVYRLRRIRDKRSRGAADVRALPHAKLQYAPTGRPIGPLVGPCSRRAYGT